MALSSLGLTRVCLTDCWLLELLASLGEQEDPGEPGDLGEGLVRFITVVGDVSNHAGWRGVCPDGGLSAIGLLEPTASEVWILGGWNWIGLGVWR